MTIHFVRRGALYACTILTAAALLGAADVLSQLGVTPAAAREALMSSLSGATGDYYVAAKAFKAAAPAARAGLVDAVVVWAKAYTATPEFKAAYAKMREIRKPHAPEFKGTPEEEFARQQEEQAKDIAKGLASMPPEMRKEMEAAMKEAAAAMSTPEAKKMIVDGIRAERQQKTDRYNEELKRWSAEYPEDARVAIAGRLREFLEMSAGVDFSAKLEKRGSLMRFADQQYEDKPAEWKLCYRAGKEATTAARAAAEAWLKELGPSGTR